MHSTCNAILSTRIFMFLSFSWKIFWFSFHFFGKISFHFNFLVYILIQTAQHACTKISFVRLRQHGFGSTNKSSLVQQKVCSETFFSYNSFLLKKIFVVRLMGRCETLITYLQVLNLHSHGKDIPGSIFIYNGLKDKTYEFNY